MAEKPPATANANVPKISMRFKKLEYIILKIRATACPKKESRFKNRDLTISNCGLF